MRLDLHTDEQFAAVEDWFEQSGQAHLPGAWLVRAARCAGISLINLSDCGDDLRPENLDYDPAFVLVSAVSQPPEMWPQHKLFLPWARCGVVYSEADVYPRFYEGCVDEAKKHGRFVMVEGVAEYAHEWSRAFITAGTPYTPMVPASWVPPDRIGAVLN